MINMDLQQLIGTLSAQTPRDLERSAEHRVDGDSGARSLDQWLERHLLPTKMDGVLNAMVLDAPLSVLHAGLDDNGRPTCEFSQ